MFMTRQPRDRLGTAGETRYTLFAPTNDAFQSLGIGVATSLLMPANQVRRTSVCLFSLIIYLYIPNIPLLQVERTLDMKMLNQTIEMCLRQVKLYQIVRYHLLSGELVSELLC